MHKLCNILEAILRYCILLVMTIMIIAMSLQVIIRFLPFPAPHWAGELSRFALVWLVFLGLPIATRKSQHMAITSLVNKFSVSAQRLLELVSMILIVCFSALMVIYAWKAVVLSTSFRAVSLPISMSHLYFIICPSGLLMILFTVENFIGKFFIKQPGS